MTIIELFTEIFGEDIFVGPKTQGRADKRTGAYMFMSKAMKMSNEEIANEIGKTRSTVISGVKRFSGLLEMGDPTATGIWKSINERANAILSHAEGEILEIDIIWQNAM